MYRGYEGVGGLLPDPLFQILQTRTLKAGVFSLSKDSGCSRHYHRWYHTAREVRVTHLQTHRVSYQTRPRLRPHRSQTLNPRALQGRGLLVVTKKITCAMLLSVSAVS